MTTLSWELSSAGRHLFLEKEDNIGGVFCHSKQAVVPGKKVESRLFVKLLADSLSSQQTLSCTTLMQTQGVTTSFQAYVYDIPVKLMSVAEISLKCTDV